MPARSSARTAFVLVIVAGLGTSWAKPFLKELQGALEVEPLIRALERVAAALIQAQHDEPATLSRQQHNVSHRYAPPSQPAGSTSSLTAWLAITHTQLIEQKHIDVGLFDNALAQASAEAMARAGAGAQEHRPP